MPRRVYRKGSTTDKNFTPRPDQDTIPGPGEFPGLSVYERLELLNANPGDVIQILDLDLLPTSLRALADDLVAGGQEGHLSIAPVTETGTIDMAALLSWSATRDAGGNHPLTGDVKTAIVGKTKA